jgi:hypothetical protein
MSTFEMYDGYIFLDETGEKLELVNITASWDEMPDITY